MGNKSGKLNRRLAVRALALMLALLFAMPSFATMEDMPDLPEASNAVEMAVEPADETEADTEAEPADDAPEAGEASPESDADDIAVPEADDAPLDLSGEIWLDDLALGALSANEEQPSREDSGDEAPTGFHETVTVGDGRVTLTALPGSFPAGATLRASKSDDEAVARLCEAALEVETCTHRLYSIEVLDDAGNAILPDYDMELPTVRVDGIDPAGDTRVFYYDWVEQAVFELTATTDGSAVEFAFRDSVVYDVVTLSVNDTAEPTDAPTEEPSAEPPEEPTVEPTTEPIEKPTVELMEESVAESTAEPTAESSKEPSEEPTAEPTEEPTAGPTEEPTVAPTEESTAEPTVEPTAEPTEELKAEPTIEPTVAPTEEPTVEPTTEPAVESTAEPTEAPVAYPAQRFADAVAGVSVQVEAPEGAFPEGTTLRVTPVWDDSTLSDIETAVSGDFVEVKRIHAVDITFLDVDGAEIEPRVPISVVLTLEEMTRQQEAVVVHVDDEGNAAVVERAEAPEVAFEAESFSVYALVVTEAVEQVVKASDGRDYRITVAYSPDAGIPDGATLSVAEITDADARAAYEAEAAAAMGIRASSIGYGRLFDITILADGEAVQPRAGATVDVRVTLADADGANVSVVHFARAPESVNADIDGDTVAFTTGGFSVYGFFTVDFWYGEYEYHLPGEGEILLSELFALLGIEDSAANAREVTFTAPQYLSIQQLEDDWKLTSLAPFDTEETLTVKFADGEISVRVTDADGDITVYLQIGAGTNDGDTAANFNNDRNINSQTSGASYAVTVPEGTNVTVTVTNTATDPFSCWIDAESKKIVSTERNFGIKLTESMNGHSYIAVFPHGQRFAYIVNHETMGKLIRNGTDYTNTYNVLGLKEGVTATPNTGYEFAGQWSIHSNSYEKQYVSLAAAKSRNDIFNELGISSITGNAAAVTAYFRPTAANTAQITYQTALLDYDGTTVLTAASEGALVDASSDSAAVAAAPSEASVTIAKSHQIMLDSNLEVIDDFAVSAAAPATGYSFAGWRLGTVNGAELGDELNPTISLSDIWAQNSDITLVAVYKKNPPEKKIIVYFPGTITKTGNEDKIESGNNGTGGSFTSTSLPNPIVIYESDGRVTDLDGNVQASLNAKTGFALTTTTNQGYTFGGWYGSSHNDGTLTKFSSGENDGSYKGANFTIEKLAGKSPYISQRAADEYCTVEIDLYPMFAKDLTITYRSVSITNTVEATESGIATNDGGIYSDYGEKAPNSNHYSSFKETVKYDRSNNKYAVYGANFSRSAEWITGFLGWYRDDVFVSNQSNYKPSINDIYDGVILTAITNKNKGVRYFYDVQEAGELSVSKMQEYTAFQTVTVYPANGYRFTGWKYRNSTNEEVDITGATTTTLSEATAKTGTGTTTWPGGTNIFTAKIEFIKPTIRYVSADTEHGRVSLESETLTDINGVLAGSTASVTDEESGYYFDGWFLGDTLVSANANYIPTSEDEDIGPLLAYCTANNVDEVTVQAHFSNAPLYTVHYVAQANGTVNNSTDTLAGSNLAKGSTATANDGYEFFGWYVGDTLVLDTETITASHLRMWLERNVISSTNNTITARFGQVYTLTYQKKLGDSVPEDLATESIKLQTPAGYTAPELSGYNFVGWYETGETPLTTENALTAAEIGNVTSDRTFVARYSPAFVATYEAEYLNEGKTGVSNYGYVSVGGETATPNASLSVNANTQNELVNAAQAVSATGCEFVQWVVTRGGTALSAGEVLSRYGFDVNSPGIPANLTLNADVTFKAQFQKQTGAIELIYNIQRDTDPVAYAASLTLGGTTRSGEPANENVYLSEVVPAGGTAIGCTAEGTEYSNQNYRIIGWAKGEDGLDTGKDDLIVRTKTLKPLGEYLDDVNGNGVRYFRVVTKKEKNIYILFKVSGETSGGYIAHSSTTNPSQYEQDKLHHINAEGDTNADGEMRTVDQVFNTETTYSFNGANRTGVAYYGVYINSGYKLVGFSFNGVSLELKDAMTTNGLKIKPGNFTVENPDWTDGEDEADHYIDLITYMNAHSKLYLESATTEVSDEEHVNILVAVFSKDGYNIEYRVKNGVGGTVTNAADSYSTVELGNNIKDNGSTLIAGSTALPDSDNNYVFDHWEDADGNKIDGAGAFYKPETSSITVPNLTYVFYAVFVKKSVNLAYVPDSPEHGSTTRAEETVLWGSEAEGSTAQPETGWVFDYWALEDGTKLDGEAATFKPVPEESDFLDVPKTITYVAHFKRQNNTLITVNKNVAVEDPLALTDVNTTIYICLQKKPDDASEAFFVTDRDDKVLYKAIDIVNGMPTAPVTFEGLDYGTYDVWEMYQDIEGNYARQYAGMAITSDYKLSKISGSNNAVLTVPGDGSEAAATVTFTNTYAPVNSTISFRARKQWQNESDTDAPDGAKVVFTIYSEVGGITTAVQSVELDGVVDDSGETQAWTATFSGLPELPGGGKYKVAETTGWLGYTAYERGVEEMKAGVFMYQENGKIVNIKDDITVTGALKLTKTFAVPAGVTVPDGSYEFALVNVDDGVSETVTLTVTGGAISGAALGAGSSYAKAYDDNDHSLTISGLPVGTYTLTEQKTDTVTWSGQAYTWTVTGVGDYTVAVNETTEAKVVNTFTPLPSLTIDKTVTGGMGDWDRAFAFTLSGLTAGGAYPFRMYSTADGTNYAAMTGAGTSGTLTADGGAVTFNLKHRQRIVIDNLPPNARLTVAEQNLNYTTTWALNGATQTATSDSGTSTVSFDMPTSDATLAVTNNLEPVSPTGVRARNGPYLLMLLLAVAMLAARRRRGHRKRGGADG